MTGTNLLNRMLQASPHPAWLIDREGRVRVATPSAISLYGPLQHVLERNPGFRSDEHQALFARVQAGEAVSFVARLRKDGRMQDVRVEARGCGHPDYFIAWFVPEAVTDVLIETERLASMGTLAAGMGHELNQPLTVLLGNLGVASTELRSHDDASLDDVRAALADARRGAERIRDVVSDLMAFSRSDEGTLEPVLPMDLIETAITMAAPQFRHHARLHRELLPCPPVLGNLTQLSQVVVNLLVNAAQATEDTPDARIAVRCHLERDMVVIDVADNGRGVPPEARARIFQPFVTTKDRGEGTGLGLAIGRQIVRRLGGRLDLVEARETTFRVTLPTLAGASFHEPSPTPMPETEDVRMTVLVVDDEPLVLATLRRALSRMAVIETAESMNAALRVLATRDVDAILCDVMMPGFGGLDFYRALRERHPAMVPRTIFMSGGSPMEPTQRALIQAGRPVLEKPFDLAVLRALLDRIRKGEPVR